jgi:hypothetical protein
MVCLAGSFISEKNIENDAAILIYVNRSKIYR